SWEAPNCIVRGGTKLDVSNLGCGGLIKTLRMVEGSGAVLFREIRFRDRTSLHESPRFLAFSLPIRASSIGVLNQRRSLSVSLLPVVRFRSAGSTSSGNMLGDTARQP